MSNLNNNIALKMTADGSHTLYNRALNEHYHSVHGSIQESLHVFIRMGLDFFKAEKKEVSIFEVGFGTGLNAYLTLLNKGKLKLNYTGIEPYPLDFKLVQALNYVHQVNAESGEMFEKLHTLTWGQWHSIQDGFRLKKIEIALQNWKNSEKHDLIFFDAFAPRPQPEMWNVPIFESCFDLLEKGGILVTYCAKGQVRRNMERAGFITERLQGPPGKREMLRALKP